MTANIHQWQNYAHHGLGTRNPQGDAAFEAAVNNVQKPPICGRRHGIEQNLHGFVMGLSYRNRNPQGDAAFRRKELRGHGESRTLAQRSIQHDARI